VTAAVRGNKLLPTPGAGPACQCGPAGPGQRCFPLRTPPPPPPPLAPPAHPMQPDPGDHRQRLSAASPAVRLQSMRAAARFRRLCPTPAVPAGPAEGSRFCDRLKRSNERVLPWELRGEQQGLERKAGPLHSAGGHARLELVGLAELSSAGQLPLTISGPGMSEGPGGTSQPIMPWGWYYTSMLPVSTPAQRCYSSSL